MARTGSSEISFLQSLSTQTEPRERRSECGNLWSLQPLRSTTYCRRRSSVRNFCDCTTNGRLQGRGYCIGHENKCWCTYERSRVLLHIIRRLRFATAATHAAAPRRLHSTPAKRGENRLSGSGHNNGRAKLWGLGFRVLGLGCDLLANSLGPCK